VSKKENCLPPNAMKTYHTVEISLIRWMVVGGSFVLVCVIGVIAYPILGGRQWLEARSYKMSQLSADARTVAAALSYLLEPESDLPRETIRGRPANSAIRG
jgi:hypothetical protein